MGRVVIGMDPHKRSATIEVCDERERVLQTGRFGTDRDGYRQLLAAGRRWPERVWAVEGCQGVGRHLAQRLVADGEPVVDVPAKLSARARVFSTGQGRKTDATDAHSDALLFVNDHSLDRFVRGVAVRVGARRCGAPRRSAVRRSDRRCRRVRGGGPDAPTPRRQGRTEVGVEPHTGPPRGGPVR